VLDAVRSRGERILGGEELFRLYDTFGIPVDLIGELAEEEGVTLDLEGFETMMAGAKAKAKASSKFQSSTDAATFAKVAEKTGPTEFVGYDQYVDVPSTVKAIVVAGVEQDAIHHGSEGEVVLSPTPFYAESGGQVADTGTLEWDGGRATVLDTQKPSGDLVVSRVRVDEGSLAVHSQVRASVPVPARLDTTANHTATHLLHQALKGVLGETVQQAGSLVAPDRLRFDYTYHQAPSEAQQRQVEEIVNDKIRANLEVTKTVMPIAEAKKTGAVAMFGEKYGENVRIVTAIAPATSACSRSPATVRWRRECGGWKRSPAAARSRTFKRSKMLRTSCSNSSTCASRKCPRNCGRCRSGRRHWRKRSSS